MLTLTAIVIMQQDSKGGAWKRGPSDHHLNCAFQAEGGLWLLIGPGLPPRKVLVQVRGERWVKVQSLRDLEGHVRISTAQEAMQFVRLASSPLLRLNNRARESEYEIVPKESLSLSFAFGDAKGLAQLKSFRVGTAGLVSLAWFHNHHIELPAVQPVLGGWQISRPIVLVSYGKEKAKTFRVTETVLLDGTYRRVDKEERYPAPGAGGWDFFPIED